MSASKSLFFASVLAVSLSQNAFSPASAEASFSSLAMRSEISPFTFTNGSSPACAPYLKTVAMRLASCARVAEWCCLANFFTRATISAFAKSVRVLSVDSTLDFCKKLYVCDSAPAVVSDKTFLASAKAASSDARAATDASWSLEILLQLAVAMASFSLSLARLASVCARSPSAVAFASEAALFAFFSSARFLPSASIESSKLCFVIS
mmetsp:Transcript_48192/g.90253  ORF Transcript_48192/g.90253 Transcript_48192/m.90253 type:complete len:208 (-) Transcript_48192:824-1447(-)